MASQGLFSGDSDVGALAIPGRTVEDFEDLVIRYQVRLARTCYVVLRRPDLVEDALQETWGIAWRKLHQLRSEDRVAAWLTTIALRQAVRIARRERGAQRVGEPARTDESPVGRDLDLERAIGLLSLADRQLLALTVVAGFDSSEVGRILGLSGGGVRTRKARVLARLRKELDRER